MKEQILEHLCYTDLVYQRINKKLKLALTNFEIEELMSEIISASQSTIERRGKNFYIEHATKKIRITVNANTYSVITADRIHA
ncbi:DUF3781 domain-containing protein [Enterococcus sp. LJL120]